MNGKLQSLHDKFEQENHDRLYDIDENLDEGLWFNISDQTEHDDYEDGQKHWGKNVRKKPFHGVILIDVLAINIHKHAYAWLRLERADAGGTPAPRRASRVVRLQRAKPANRRR